MLLASRLFSATPPHHIMGHYRICPCKYILYRCIRFTQDANHHLVQIDLSVQVTTVSSKSGSIMVCLCSTNFSVLIRHTSTDFEDIFTDHVT